jgi:predicted nucleotidyltransferase
MKVLAVIVEYNPFHLGHRYLIEALGQNQHFDAVICIMSGDFVQRGEPAVCSKWARAEMALRGGADLVIELPFIYAVRSAYYFARGAIQSLAACGVVSHLGFGSESGNIKQLQHLAGIIAAEPADYRDKIKEHLALGLSFPAARSRALQAYLGLSGSQADDLLLGPNNILALEYLRVIAELNLPLYPLTIKRKGQAYHDSDLGSLASATAIRQALFNPQEPEDITSHMPSSAWEILQRETVQGRAPVAADSLEQAVLSRFRTLDLHEIRQLYEVSEGLEYRIYEGARSCGTLAELRRYIKSRRYSMTRVNRILLYGIMGVNRTLTAEIDQHGPSYLHVLGFSSQGQKILQQINKRSRLQVLNRGKDVKRFFEENRGYAPGAMLGLDIKAADVYSLLMPDPSARSGAREFTTSPVRV